MPHDFVLRAYPSAWSLERSANAEALKLLDQAIAIEPHYPLALSLAAWCHAQQVVYNWATEPAGEKALALDPNSGWAWNRSGWLQSYLGSANVSIEHFERALRLSPFDPMNFNVFIGIGSAHFIADRYADAVFWFEKGLLERPPRPGSIAT
jgi:adenylate cyclase